MEPFSIVYINYSGLSYQPDFSRLQAEGKGRGRCLQQLHWKYHFNVLIWKESWTPAIEVVQNALGLGNHPEHTIVLLVAFAAAALTIIVPG